MPLKSCSLSLCMIVRDAERTLAPALESVRPHVDEMVVLDTGSRDQTPAVAQRLGALVSHMEWPDDFAKARNQSISAARGRWIFWMDADDTIDQANGQALRQLAELDHPAEVLGFVMQVHCPGPAGERSKTVVDHIKLFRNDPRLRFEGRIHEQILPSIRRCGGRVEWTDVHVVHSGADVSAEGRTKKHARDLRLIYAALQSEPDSTFMLFNLGMTLCDAEQYEQALNALSRSLQLSTPQESHVRKVYALLAQCYQALGRLDAATFTCRQGLSLFPDDDELLFRLGVQAEARGELEEAESAFLSVIRSRPEKRFSSVDVTIKGAKAWANLARVYARQRRGNDAAEAWSRAVELDPENLGLLCELLRACLRERDEQALQKRVGRLNGVGRVGRVLLAGALDEIRGELSRAQDHFEGAGALAPDSTHVLDAVGRFYFEHGRWESAAGVISKLVTLDPECSAARYNLGVAMWELGRLDEARVALQACVRLCPTHPGAAALLRRLGAADRIGSGQSQLGVKGMAP